MSLCLKLTSHGYLSQLAAANHKTADSRKMNSAVFNIYLLALFAFILIYSMLFIQDYDIALE